ncbi:MAG: hypothetical protein ISQ34_02980 [Rickettsiales bacterium]|nr:hypothetical protein [Rickettsiales bacterium]
MKSILKYILLSAIRDKFYIGLLITLGASFGLSIFLGSSALVEQQQMTASFIAGSSRVILAIGMILFVCLNIHRAFENKEVEFIISKAISREKFILGYLLGFLLAASFIFIPLNIAVSIVVKANFYGLVIWSLSLFLELVILICFALLASLILKNSFSAIMASFGFYIISRMMGVFVLAISIPDDVSLINKNNILQIILKILSAIFPRLDLFAQSKWLNYGFNNSLVLQIILVQSFIYIALMLFMSFHDFKKKQF